MASHKINPTVFNKLVKTEGKHEQLKKKYNQKQNECESQIRNYSLSKEH